MKIAILTSSFPYRKGDFHGKFIYYQALGQVQLGNEVHVICPHLPGLAFEEEINGIFVHRFSYFYPYNLQRLANESGMYFSLMHSFLAWVQLPLFIISEWYMADRVVRRYGIDIIHSHWIIPQGLAGIACKIVRRSPHVISSHVADAQIFSKWHFMKPVLRLILSETDVLTTNSTFTKKVIEDLQPVPCPCRVIPMGVLTPEKPILSSPMKASRILYIGRLIEWKGVDTLFRAMPTVLKEKPGTILSVVGIGEELDNLKKLARELGIEGHVEFLGQVNDERLSALYTGASVLVLPSRPSQGIVMEGLGVVLLEAMSRGVPVIGSNVGGIPDVITDGLDGFLFPYDDEKVLAEGIVLLLSDDAIIEKFRKNGYDTVKTRFSWDAISRGFFDIYSQVQKK